MYAVVAGVGIPAAFRNLTALGMVIAWLFVELVYQIAGDSLPLRYSFMADIAVISIVYAKTIRRVGAKTYPTLGKQIYCLFVDLTPYDRWIVAIFLLGVWPSYVMEIDPWWKWHLLWALTMAQFLLAGVEALACSRVENRKVTDTPIIDRHMAVIPFPCRVADAVRTPSPDDLLIVEGSRGYG